jgi:hypothetical protein
MTYEELAKLNLPIGNIQVVDFIKMNEADIIILDYYGKISINGRSIVVAGYVPEHVNDYMRRQKINKIYEILKPAKAAKD